MHNALTDVPGLQVGHWTNPAAGTGCTVVLCPDGAVAGVEVRGAAPGTRETDLLNPICTVERIHGLLLGGGSAFGLAAADGVMRWLEERGVGYDVGVARVPIVPAAILFDLPCGRADVRPDAAAGYAACQAAHTGPVAEGSVGAGTGATVGKILGFHRATKGGVGTAARQIAGGVVVAALTAVNAFGEVFDPRSGRTIAGPRKPGGGFADTMAVAQQNVGQTLAQLAAANTTLAVVATNARLTKTCACKVAQMAHNGLARTIRPVHTLLDGDTVFALSMGDRTADTSLIGALAADLLAEAVLNAIQAAESLHDIPSARDLGAV